MSKLNKYNANIIYFNRELNISFPAEIGEGLPGFQRFDSEFELKVYKEILKHTYFVECQRKFNLFASKLIIDFFLVYLGTANQLNFLAIEAKGFQTQIWRLKYKEFKVLYPQIKVFVIRKNTDILKLQQILINKNFCEITEDLIDF